jgi:hypothetical protein
MSDVAQEGQSSVINEDSLGNDRKLYDQLQSKCKAQDKETNNVAASWFDHPRDLLHLVNVKRAEMPRPIVGIGHSMGGAHL